jgi:hypothetical protein
MYRFDHLRPLVRFSIQAKKRASGIGMVTAISKVLLHVSNHSGYIPGRPRMIIGITLLWRTVDQAVDVCHPDRLLFGVKSGGTFTRSIREWTRRAG